MMNHFIINIFFIGSSVNTKELDLNLPAQFY